MSNKESVRKLLNHLVDEGFTANLAGDYAMSALLRWGEEDAEIRKQFENAKASYYFLFEIGRNCGTVFSADCVKNLEINGNHVIIHLKG